MIAIFPISKNFKFAFLDYTSMRRLLSLRHYNLIMLAFQILGLLCQFFDLVVGEAVEEWDFAEEVELAIILFDFDLFKDAHIVVAVEDCHLCDLHRLYRLFPF